MSAKGTKVIPDGPIMDRDETIVDASLKFWKVKTSRGKSPEYFCAKSGFNCATFKKFTRKKQCNNICAGRADLHQTNLTVHSSASDIWLLFDVEASA